MIYYDLNQYLFTYCDTVRSKQALKETILIIKYNLVLSVTSFTNVQKAK